MQEAKSNDIVKAISAMLAERGDGKTICPSEVARALAGPDETRWRLLMKPIRTEAVRMAEAGELTIRRKGRVIDPRGFKGIYRLGWPLPADGPAKELAGAAAGEAAAGDAPSPEPAGDDKGG